MLSSLHTFLHASESDKRMLSERSGKCRLGQQLGPLGWLPCYVAEVGAVDLNLESGVLLSFHHTQL